MIRFCVTHIVAIKQNKQLKTMRLIRESESVGTFFLIFIFEEKYVFVSLMIWFFAKNLKYNGQSKYILRTRKTSQESYISELRVKILNGCSF